MSGRVLLGVDIGGTKVAAGLVDETGNILSKVRVPMIAESSADIAIDCVYRAIEKALQSSQVTAQAIGISSPGPLDPRTGVILQTPNLPCWRNFPLLEHVQKRYGIRTKVENDANAAGLAEALWGAGKNFKSVFYATFGTGVGTAIVQEGTIYHGRTGLAAEGGHMTIDINAPVRCGCGKRGCFESMVSGPAIAFHTRERLSLDGAQTVLKELQEDQLTAEGIINAWESRDSLATEIMKGVLELLAVWLGNIIDLLEPEVMVIGGGLGARLSAWLPEISARIPGCTINTRAAEIPLVAAHYGADSGIAGAAALFTVDEAVSPVGN